MRDTSVMDQKTENADEVLKYIPSLRAYARGLTRNADDADDLVQETLVKAIANISKFQPGTNLGAWLFTIMRNSFLTDVRKRTREKPGTKDCVSATPVSYPSHETYITGQRLFASIAKLPPHYREILLLVVVIGESYEDTAAICGCAVGTIKSRVNRARKMVMEDLGTTDILEILDVTPRS
ncbi:MAG: sigma-70 family RNA polymerase sigma factor [Gemmobacter sp.]|jgi:RNA polymerase sigma-70 factor, ECF subfamily|nr:sigma-70 family RNA polymerase sigma factor [Gemmobacter sp.]